MPYAVLVLVTFVVCCSQAKADEDPRIVTLKRLAQKIDQAGIDRDFETLLDLTYPKAAKIYGDRKTFIRDAKLKLEKLEQEGIYAISAKSGEPSKLFKEGSSTFAVVPHEIVTKIPEGKLLGKSYSLGISTDDGKTWTFVGGEALANKK